MAKGNMLQGMARGKVGDVVFSRLNGQQISRVRNRQPYNPRTNKQLIQRAVMASVMQAYSIGKDIFDHSFQGKSVGSGCQRQFMKLNAKLLRNAIADDINNDVAIASQTGRVVAPGSIYAVPFAFQISEGTYPQNLFDEGMEANGTPTFALPEAEDNEKVSEYAARVGLIAGDIFTFVIAAETSNLVFTTPGTDSNYAKQYAWDWGWIRLTVKDGLDSVNDAVSTYGQLFDIEQGGTIQTSGISADRNISSDLGMMAFTENEMCSVGLIRSRKDMDLRSTSFLSGMKIFKSGIASQYILDAWKAGTTPVGDSDLILEGGDI